MNHSIAECERGSKEGMCIYVSLSKHQKREVGTARMKIENGVKKPNSIYTSIQNSCSVIYQRFQLCVSWQHQSITMQGSENYKEKKELNPTDTVTAWSLLC